MKKNKGYDLLNAAIKREQLFGVPPEEQLNFPQQNSFTVHKSAKKDRVSFLITKALLDQLNETSKKIGKKPKLIIAIKNYTLTCEVTNE
jgi:hypothetical protein